MPNNIEVSMTPDVKAEFEKVNHAVAALREKNDETIAKGIKDALDGEHLQRINNAIDDHQTKLDNLVKTLSRKDKGVDSGETAERHQARGEYKAAFNTYLRKGRDDGLVNLQAKAMSISSDEDGGYTVTPEMSDTISKVIQEFSPMRSVANVQTISSDSLDILVDKDLQGAAWTGETETRSDTATPGFGKVNIPTHEMYASPKATQKLIDDSSVDIESWIAEKVAERFAVLEGAAFVSGDGNSKPRGILTYTAGTAYGEIEQIANGHATTLSADSIVKLYYGLKEAYAANSTFMMKRSTIQTVRLLKESTTNAYIWQPGLAAGHPDTLLGRPVAEATDMPAISSAALPIAIGDFRRGYQIVDRLGVRVLRDPFTDKPFIKFYTTKRVGGGVMNFEAIKLLVMST